MEAATAFATRRPESLTDASPIPTGDSDRALAVKAIYLLSEEGRKASLLAGGDGRAVQELTLQVPANRLHLVSVDADGIARLKLRPSYRLDGEQSVVRVDSAPTYDAPPDIEELFREAARNHQLGRAYQAERRSLKTKRREADAERRAQIAQAFLAEPTKRALVHPAPTPDRCYLPTEHGRILFDSKTDDVHARQVPQEAHRRFRSDLRLRKENNHQSRVAELAVHEQKKQAVTEWIASNGTPEQQARQAAGVLPMDEAIEAMTDQAFAVVIDRARYARDGADRLQAYLRQFPQYANVVITMIDLRVTSANAAKASAAQWALVREIQGLLPGATATLREHTLAWKGDPEAPTLSLFGVLVSCKVGPFNLRREFSAPCLETER